MEGSPIATCKDRAALLAHGADALTELELRRENRCLAAGVLRNQHCHDRERVVTVLIEIELTLRHVLLCLIEIEMTLRHVLLCLIEIELTLRHVLLCNVVLQRLR